MLVDYLNTATQIYRQTMCNIEYRYAYCLAIPDYMSYCIIHAYENMQTLLGKLKYHTNI
jgi:hypothetical protein